MTANEILQSTKTPVVTLFPNEEWNKVYINLVTEVSWYPNALYYNLFFGATEKSTAISYKWASDVLTKIQEVQTSQTDPSEYAQSIGDFVSEQTDVATENLAALAEVAKKAQLDSVSLFVATAKEVQDETAASVKKAANDFAPTQKKA